MAGCGDCRCRFCRLPQKTQCRSTPSEVRIHRGAARVSFLRPCEPRSGGEARCPAGRTRIARRTPREDGSSAERSNTSAPANRRTTLEIPRGINRSRKKLVRRRSTGAPSFCVLRVDLPRTHALDHPLVELAGRHPDARLSVERRQIDLDPVEGRLVMERLKPVSIDHEVDASIVPYRAHEHVGVREKEIAR